MFCVYVLTNRSAKHFAVLTIVYVHFNIISNKLYVVMRRSSTLLKLAYVTYNPQTMCYKESHICKNKDQQRY